MRTGKVALIVSWSGEIPRLSNIKCNKRDREQCQTGRDKELWCSDSFRCLKFPLQTHEPVHQTTPNDNHHCSCCYHYSHRLIVIPDIPYQFSYIVNFASSRNYFLRHSATFSTGSPVQQLEQVSCRCRVPPR